MDASISPAALTHALAARAAPLLIDVRRQPVFLESPELIRGALRRDPAHVAQWARALPRGREVVVYCVHGHQVSQGAAGALREAGSNARYLEGGIEAWRAAGGAISDKPVGASSRWITRERPKIDRIACPWLVRRFVDRDAQFLYVPGTEVRRIATEQTATPYDVPDVTFAHVGERCSFDAFVDHYRLAGDPALRQLAAIVRGADTDRLELAPQAAGLLAISLGLSRLYRDDTAMLEQGMVMYDALYAWCRHGHDAADAWTFEGDR